MSTTTPVAAKDGIISPNTAMNTIELDETRARRLIRVRFTDTTAESVASVVGGLLWGGAIAPMSRSKRQPVVERDYAPEQLVLPSVTTEAVPAEESMTIINGVATAATNESDLAKMRRIFRKDGDRLRLDETRIRATNHADAVRRLTYLFVYAKELEEHGSVLRSDLHDALRDVKEFDGNSGRAISERDFVVDGDNISLRMPGREHAQQFMDEALNHELPNVYELGSRTRGTKTVTEGDGERAAKPTRRRGRSPSHTVPTWVNAWKALSLPVDGHAKLQARSVADKGIFGLWAIRHAMGDTAKEVTRGNLSKFLWEAFEISANDKNLQRALEKQTDKVRNVHGATFQILPPGQQYALQIAGLDATAVAPGGASGKQP
jgi:hypothetical protein